MQPGPSKPHVNVTEIKQTATTVFPKQCDMVKVGDMCVFRNTGCKNWKIGCFFIPLAKQPKHGNVHRIVLV